MPRRLPAARGTVLFPGRSGPPPRRGAVEAFRGKPQSQESIHLRNHEPNRLVADVRIVRGGEAQRESETFRLPLETHLPGLVAKQAKRADGSGRAEPVVLEPLHEQLEPFVGQHFHLVVPSRRGLLGGESRVHHQRRARPFHGWAFATPAAAARKASGGMRPTGSRRGKPGARSASTFAPARSGLRVGMSTTTAGWRSSSATRVAQTRSTPGTARGSVSCSRIRRRASRQAVAPGAGENTFGSCRRHQDSSASRAVTLSTWLMWVPPR
jgi:hypothetical protein